MAPHPLGSIRIIILTTPPGFLIPLAPSCHPFDSGGLLLPSSSALVLSHSAFDSLDSAVDLRPGLSARGSTMSPLAFISALAPPASASALASHAFVSALALPVPCPCSVSPT
ncbi:hypothetical protein DPX16_16631 [Anabarilius grahami]|uniref:Uncharacterized protein n=1 Tax=Anabarilius grahami TaxID=495550 RepID=A0A3N0YS61_ANAGA|nr:hypothetical protein DPX16_16631 [Anabarilius grahami]